MRKKTGFKVIDCKKGDNLMKIQGPNPFINAYRNQQQKQIVKKSEQPKDQLDISTKAKQLQSQDVSSIERSKRVTKIKQLVQSGEYKIDYQQTAQKMIDFWTNQK